MRAPAVICALVAAILAGCIQDVPAEEQLVVSITDVGKVPYSFVLPLWLFEGGANASAWVAANPIKSGQVTQFHLINTERGAGILVAGNGTVTLGFEDVRTNVGPAFTKGGFSMGASPQGLPYLFVNEGEVDVNFHYEAVAEECFATGSFWWMTDGVGWHAAVLGGRMSFSPDCPP